MNTALPPPVAELVIRFQRRQDPAAFDLLYQSLTPLIRSVGRRYRLSSHDVDDLVQNVWMLFWQHATGINQPDRVGPWLWATASNVCRHRIRRERRHVITNRMPDHAAHPDAQPEACTLRADDRRLVRTLLSEVRPDERRLIIMLTSEPRPDYRQIAARIERPIGSIGPTRVRILGKLRRALDDATAPAA